MKEIVQPISAHAVVGIELVRIPLILLPYLYVYIGQMLDQACHITEVVLLFYVGRQCIIQLGNVDKILEIILERTLRQIFHLLDISNVHRLEVLVVCVSRLCLVTVFRDVIA